MTDTNDSTEQLIQPLLQIAVCHSLSGDIASTNQYPAKSDGLLESYPSSVDFGDAEKFFGMLSFCRSIATEAGHDFTLQQKRPLLGKSVNNINQKRNELQNLKKESGVAS